MDLLGALSLDDRRFGRHSTSGGAGKTYADTKELDERVLQSGSQNAYDDQRDDTCEPDQNRRVRSTQATAGFTTYMLLTPFITFNQHASRQRAIGFPPAAQLVNVA